jgi:hypothetical protein
VGLKIGRSQQNNLVITPLDEPEITVDNVEVAQFVYLLLHNEKVRDVIDTITSKAVLILGRFTDERKAVLDALRDELRNRNLLPILFDFAIPASRDVTETIKTLASLARFVIADVTDATEVRVELQKIVHVDILITDRSRPEGERAAGNSANQTVRATLSQLRPATIELGIPRKGKGPAKSSTDLTSRTGIAGVRALKSAQRAAFGKTRLPWAVNSMALVGTTPTG